MEDRDREKANDARLSAARILALCRAIDETTDGIRALARDWRDDREGER